MVEKSAKPILAIVRTLIFPLFVQLAWMLRDRTPNVLARIRQLRELDAARIHL